MTSPSHGEDRRFNSGRAHFTIRQGRIEPATNNPFGIAEFVGAGSIPAEPIPLNGESALTAPSKAFNGYILLRPALSEVYGRA